MASPAAHFFDPPAANIPTLLADFRRDDLSFSALAKLHDTTPDALALWLASPDIARLLESTDSMVCYRTRLIAAEQLPIALRTCIHILEDFNTSRAPRATDRGSVCLDSAPISSDGVPSPELNLRAAVLRHRITETARKAATIVARFTRQPRTPGPNWDPAAKQRAPASESLPLEPTAPRATAPFQAASQHPTSDIQHSVQDLALAAALKLAADLDPTKDPYAVLEEILAEEEANAARPSQAVSSAACAVTPPTPPQSKKQESPGQTPEAAKPITIQPKRQIPTRNLWRHTPGAAHPP